MARVVRTTVVAALATLVATLVSPSPPTSAQPAPTDRFALASGCFTAHTADGDYLSRTENTVTATGASPTDAEPWHLRATDLGRYLLFGSERDFLAASDGELGKALDGALDNSAGAMADGLSRGTTGQLADDLAEGPLGTTTGRGARIVTAVEPSDLADWRVIEAPGGFHLSLPSLDAWLTTDDSGTVSLTPNQDDATTLAFRHATGCAPWPEAEVNVSGPVATGETPYGEVRGFLDGHLHGMAFEFAGGRARCGRPWHRFGVTEALRGCQEHEASSGRTHVLEAVLSGRDPIAGHDTQGWPTFHDWPAHDSLTYEQVYYRWLERAWRGGLRMVTNLLVENHALCEQYPFKRNDCNEMNSAALQAKRIRQLERYIDAQHGGPGKGWLRIVDDPFEARRVANSGKLAVVLGVELSVPFDCGLKANQPTCDREQIDAAVDELYDLGVRQLELVNKFDNALTGVKGDAGSTGVVVNGGNFYSTGQFWRMRNCEDEHAHDHTQPNVSDDSGAPKEFTGRDSIFGAILAATGTSGVAPVYPEGPHCNVRGLSDLGKHALNRIIERGMLFDPDHMSAKAAGESLDLLERRGYSGVISSHSWADKTIYPRVYELGGVVTPYAGDSDGFVEKWREHREWADDRFYFGFGYGSDTNGFGAQGAPRGDTPTKVRYPFTGFGGTTIHRQVSGERTFDVNTDGVAHYGLYPDWLEDLRTQAGEQIVDDMTRGPEAYLQMWERAIGIAPDSCRDDVEDLTDADTTRVATGMAPPEVLRALGQPASRDNRTFTYCLAEDRSLRVRFDRHDRVAQVRVSRTR